MEPRCFIYGVMDLGLSFLSTSHWTRKALEYSSTQVCEAQLAWTQQEKKSPVPQTSAASVSSILMSCASTPLPKSLQYLCISQANTSFYLLHPLVCRAPHQRDCAEPLNPCNKTQSLELSEKPAQKILYLPRSPAGLPLPQQRPETLIPAPCNQLPEIKLYFSNKLSAFTNH